MKNYLKEMLVTLADAGVEFVVGGGVKRITHTKQKRDYAPSAKGCSRCARTFEID